MIETISEDEKIMNFIHENNKKIKRKFIKNPKKSDLSILDVILLNIGVDTFFIGFAFLISVIENMKF